MQLLLVLLAISHLGHSLSMGESCSAEDIQTCGTCKNVECQVRNDNYIGDIAGVTSSAICQDWCRRRNDANVLPKCQYINYFGKKGSPVQNMCYLLSSCGIKNECTDCVAEKYDCFCSLSRIGQISSNLIKEIPGVNSERVCRQNCRKNSSCEFYTYLTTTQECFLLTRLIEPFQVRNDCRHTCAPW